MRSLHARYFEFFELSKCILVETETVRDARELERVLGRKIRMHQAPSPLVVRRQAAGHTEWYRRGYEPLLYEIKKLSINGYMVHTGLHGWLREVLLSRSDRLYTWAESVLAVVNHAEGDAVPQTVKDTLDAYEAFDIEVAPMLPDAMWQWYRGEKR